MAHVRYFVIPQATHWLVTLEGRTMAQVATRQQAITSAVVMADLMGSMHHDADVMLDDGENLTLAWTYGLDQARASEPRKLPKRPRSASRSHVKSVTAPAAA